LQYLQFVDDQVKELLGAAKSLKREDFEVKYRPEDFLKPFSFRSSMTCHLRTLGDRQLPQRAAQNPSSVRLAAQYVAQAPRPIN
jgi:hypothetical protein